MALFALSRLRNRRLWAIFSAGCLLSALSFTLTTNGFLPKKSHGTFNIMTPSSRHAITPSRQQSHARKELMKKEHPTKNSKTPQTDSMEQQALVQLSRKNFLKKVCKKHRELRVSNAVDTTRTLKQLMVMPNTRVLYCVVPKVGCSNWKRVFMVLEGHRRFMNISQIDAHFNNHLEILLSKPLDEVRHILQAYRKFLFVRHPFFRLISAYQNKIAGDQPFRQGGNWQFLDVARAIIQRYRKEAKSSDYVRGNLSVTWEEWIAYLTDPPNRDKFNDHWKEVYKLCTPCQVQYDFIGNLETVEEDSRYMFKVFGLNNVTYPPYRSRTKVTSSELYNHYFSRVSQKDLQRLWQIYRLDFELFGYPRPERLGKSVHL
ncbi:carbohydrate sulfotransferase 11-like isoform X2 [Acanthaster planci]|nr:carbohydrate sulfotransferase 11-like isoform X2 [Acanthaster planci]XP_022083508.1 carbohydrate sulfotransferase 11-like isoform X2 [Acanthaster planci]